MLNSVEHEKSFITSGPGTFKTMIIMDLQMKYSRTSKARTLMAHLSWLFQICS